MIILEDKLKSACQNISVMEAIIFWYVVSDSDRVSRWKSEYFSSYLLKTIFHISREEIIWKGFRTLYEGYVKTEQIKELVKEHGYSEYFSDSFWAELTKWRTIGACAGSYTSDIKDIDNIAEQYAKWNNFRDALEQANEMVNDLTDTSDVESVEASMRDILYFLKNASEINTHKVLLNMQDFH